MRRTRDSACFTSACRRLIRRRRRKTAQTYSSFGCNQTSWHHASKPHDGRQHRTHGIQVKLSLSNKHTTSFASRGPCQEHVTAAVSRPHAHLLNESSFKAPETRLHPHLLPKNFLAARTLTCSLRAFCAAASAQPKCATSWEGMGGARD